MLILQCFGSGLPGHGESVMTDTQASDQSSKVSELLKPVRGRLWLACLLQGVSSAAGVVPFIAVAELGRVFLAGNTEDMNHA